MDRFIDCNGTYIDLSEVMIVGPTMGDPSCLRYRITTKSGYSMEVYDQVSSVKYKNSLCKPRETFVNAWLQWNR